MQILQSATRITLLLLIMALCYMAVRQLQIAPEFKDITLMVVSFYFGGKTSQATDAPSEPAQLG